MIKAIPKPPPVVQYPKPKRLLSRRPRMTFIAGFHCYDGLVMCSDSLETDGYNKKITMKLREYFVLGQWGLMWGCSGTGAAIKNFSDKLTSLLGTEPFDKPKTERTLETAIQYMHSTYPDERLAMLIGLWDKNRRGTNLYEVFETGFCLSPVGSGLFCCSGMDAPLANTIIDSAFDSLMSVEEAARLGIFVTSIVKERTDGVGGPTEVTIYNKGDGMSHCYPLEKIEQIEQAFPPRDLYQVILDYWASRNTDIRKTSRGRWT
jgi:20S proteasome alpha/beta subunit